jgi:hypothetical protein
VNLQELHESAVYGKDIQIESKGVKDAIDLLNTHCKNALWMLHDNRPLWRGHKHDLKDFSVVDTSKSERVSNNTRNYYTAILDSSPLMADFPKRSKSLICSMTKNRALSYAMYESDWLFAVVPFDDAKIGAVNSEDIWDRQVTIGGITKRIEAWNDVWYRFHADDDINGLKELATQLKNGVMANVVVGFSKPFPAEVRKDLMKAIYTAYDPTKLGFTLHNSATIKNAKKGEVWVGGEVMMIKKPMWDRIRKAYNDLRVAAGQDVKDDE